MLMFKKLKELVLGEHSVRVYCLCTRRKTSNSELDLIC